MSTATNVKTLRNGGLWSKRKKRQTDENKNMTSRTCQKIDANKYIQSESMISLGAELGQASNADSFLEQVAKKTQELLIGRQEAETEVFLDIMIKEQGDKDTALLHVLSTMKLPEPKTLVLVNNLIHRGANTSAADAELKTPLHHAAIRNFRGVMAKLLENDALPHARDNKGNLALEVAMDNKNDDMCALLLAYMPNRFVRELFAANGSVCAELSFHELLLSNLNKTVLSVLDCMIETQGCKDNIRVYYSILDADDKGRPPTDPDFDPTVKSPLQRISYDGNKNIVYHDAVRLLTRRKWKVYARHRIEMTAFLYMLSLFSLTYSAIVAGDTADPAVYDTALQISRAVFEMFTLIMVLFALATEANQLRRHKLEYFKEAFNWLDFSSAFLLVSVLPLRFTHNNAQWYAFAFGYLIWTIRIFKFAAVFRQTGAYSQILYRVMVHDFVQFGVLFLVILLAFSGAFFLTLRGDNDLITHNETSSFWRILYVGVRTLTEAQPVVDYTGEGGYKTLGTIFMVCFIFACVVILLNILIAQLSDTYQKVQQDAQRGLEVNRAWIVARVELNSCFWFRQDYRTAHYIEYEDIIDLKNVLTKWESPPLNEMNKYIRDIWDAHDSHKMSLLTVQHRMARQEHALREINNRLAVLTRLMIQQNPPSNPKPKFYRSDSDLEEQIIQTGSQEMLKLNKIVEEEIHPVDKDTGKPKENGTRTKQKLTPKHSGVSRDESVDIDENDIKLIVEQLNAECDKQEDTTDGLQLRGSRRSSTQSSDSYLTDDIITTGL